MGTAPSPPTAPPAMDVLHTLAQRRRRITTAARGDRDRA
jgi:hypothetical protein